MGSDVDTSPLQILAATDRNMLWGCAVTLRSLLEHVSGPGAIHVTALHDGLSEWARNLRSSDELQLRSETASRVVHFTLAPKPWHADYRGKCEEQFFEVLDRTKFAGERPFYGLALRRRLPYGPTVFRVLRERLTTRIA